MALMITGMLLALAISQQIGAQENLSSEIRPQKTCTTIDTTVSGDSMQGILFNHQKITVYLPACGTAQRYDHLLFTNEETKNAVIKQLWGLPGDTIRIAENGRLFINEVAVITPYKKPYILLGYARTKMKRLEGKPLDGYLVLGRPGSLDSARIGLLHEDQILGFVKRDEPYVEKTPKNDP